MENSDRWEILRDTKSGDIVGLPLPPEKREERKYPVLKPQAFLEDLNTGQIYPFPGSKKTPAVFIGKVEKGKDEKPAKINLIPVRGKHGKSGGALLFKYGDGLAISAFPEGADIYLMKDDAVKRIGTDPQLVKNGSVLKIYGKKLKITHQYGNDFS
jgi:hypothetical protein